MADSRWFEGDLIEAVRPDLLKYAAGLCGEQDAPDLVQNCLMLALANPDWCREYRSLDALREWLLGILSQECRAHFRAMRRAETCFPFDEIVILSELTAARVTPPAPEAISYERLIERVDRIRGSRRERLTGQQEACLLLRLEGFNQLEIATILGIAQPNVSRLLRAARRKADLWAGMWTGRVCGGWFDEACRVSIYRQPEDAWDRKGLSEAIQQRRKKGMADR